jgi:hypothetical protein
MVDHDRIFKELLKTFFVEFVELFLPDAYEYLEPASVTFLDKEIFTDVVSGERHEVDLVARCRLRGREAFFLLHVEHQAQPQGRFERRMFRYCARLLEEHDLPVYPVAVFSYDEPRRPEPDSYRVEFPGWTVLDFRYRVIQLNRLNWRDYLLHPNPVASALMAKMRMTPGERKRVKAECLRLLLTLRLDPARMRLIAGFIETYLRLNAEDETWVRAEVSKLEPQEQGAYMQFFTHWHEEGMKEGLQQGLQQGEQQGEAKLILRQLTRRFGALGAELEQRVRQLNTDRLEELGDALLDFSRAEEVADWLDARAEVRQ